MSPSEQQWYWSQQGATMGPVDFDALRQLVTSGSIGPSTYVFPPDGRGWIRASEVADLFAPAAATASTVAPPPDAPPSDRFCRFCGASHDATAQRCNACGRDVATPTTVDPKIAEVICRASILAAPVINVMAAIGPGIVWALGASDPRVVLEAKRSLNCLITLGIAALFFTMVSVVLAIVVIGPILGVVGFIGLAVYCVVVGIIGLAATANGRAFRYPWSIEFLR